MRERWVVSTLVCDKQLFDPLVGIESELDVSRPVKLITKSELESQINAADAVGVGIGADPPPSLRLSSSRIC
jgi:hypothetical protein